MSTARTLPILSAVALVFMFAAAAYAQEVQITRDNVDYGKADYSPFVDGDPECPHFGLAEKGDRPSQTTDGGDPGDSFRSCT